MESVSAVAGKLADYVFIGLGRQLGYLANYNDNIQKLRNQVGKLTDMLAMVQGKIDAARRNNEQIEPRVQKWVDEVKIISGDANKFIEDEVKADMKCLNVWCINLSSCYRVSKEAQQKTEAIEKLHQEGGFESVSRPAPPPGLIEPSNIRTYSSRESLETKVMEALKDENVNIIGICGMGGVGKTTLVSKIGNQAKEDKLFDEVVMAVVSQNPNLTKIQGDIAKMLGLTLDSDDESARARSLWVRIKNEKRILVILDDVWDELKLDRVGIPCGDNHKGCQIVLTSRSKDVCGDMKAKKTFTVELLLDKESWDLFREAAGEVVDSSDINPIAKEVAAKCDGLPIAILTVGKALKNKKSKHEWNDAANQLKNSVPTNIRGMEANVFSPLKLSYDYLKSEEAKSCFLLCCLFPEDFEIPVEALVRYGWGLRLFQYVHTVDKARDRAYALVSTLIASHLLLECWDSRWVRMHDVVREVAISIASKDKYNYMVKAGILQDWQNDEKFENFTGISLMSNDYYELPGGHEYPKLQTLLLQSNSPSKIHNILFQGMKELKVLDMSDIRPLSLPPSFSGLANLRTLCLDHCALGDISDIGKLSKLEILSFSGSYIKEIPEHFSQLSCLRLFDLTDCKELTLISYGVISSLSRLEELSMKRSFLQWDVDGGDSRSNASLSELQVLLRLTSLHIRIPNASSLPTDMPFQDLTTFTISIGNEEGFDAHYPYSRALSLTLNMKILSLGWVKKLIKRTEDLDLSSFIGLRNIIPDLDFDNNGFNELKSLSISCCKEMNYLLNTSKWPPQKAFRSLERLFIKDNLNFTEICHDHLPDESLSKVKELWVEKCPKMLKIVPSHLSQILQNLEKLRVNECEKLVNAFEFEGLVKEKEQAKLLSKLESLILHGLPELVEIWKGHTEFIDLCNLQIVELEECQKLKTIFPPLLLQSLTNLKDITIASCDDLEEIFGKQKEIVVSASLGNLIRVLVVDCKKVRKLFSPSIVRGLVQLQELCVDRCPMMQEIVSDEEREEEAALERIVFPSMKAIRLLDLDNLTSFCPGRYTLEWPALESLEINECPKMKTFGYGVQVTPNLEKVKLNSYSDEWLWKGELNATVQHLFKKTGNERRKIQVGQ